MPVKVKTFDCGALPWGPVLVVASEVSIAVDVVKLGSETAVVELDGSGGLIGRLEPMPFPVTSLSAASIAMSMSRQSKKRRLACHKAFDTLWHLNGLADLNF